MNTKRLIAAVVGAIASFFGGWLVWGILLKDFFDANTIHYEGLMLMPPRLGTMFIGNLAMSWLIAYIFDHWANIRTFQGGFMAGLIISFALSLNVDMFMYSMMNLMTLTVIIVDILVSTIFGAVISGIIAAMLGTGKRTVAA
jgi:hypothetical protein